MYACVRYCCFCTLKKVLEHYIVNMYCNEILSVSDECAAEPCMNGGTCTYHTNNYVCICNAGWTGTNCTISKYYSIWFMFSFPSSQALFKAYKKQMI